MGTLALAADERVADVRITNDELSVRLRDGRTICVPLVWYPRLLNATEEQRRRWQIVGAGYGIHWKEIDEDLSSEGLLRGAPAPYRSRVRESGAGKLQSVSQLGSRDSEDADDKGILDHLIEGEEAASELVKVLSVIESETDAFAGKLNKHTSNIEHLAGGQKKPTARDFKRLVLLAAADMNTFSRRIGDLLPRFESSTSSLEQSYSAYVESANPNSAEDVERINNLLKSLAEMLSALRPAKESIVSFRDSSAGIRSQNISKELNKAAQKQVETLDKVLAGTGQIESFGLKISFLISERFGLSSTS